MAEKKAGRVIHVRLLSDMLEILRLVPVDGSILPPYEAGQHIALSRDECNLTKKILSEDGQPAYAYDVDPTGAIKRGTVTRSYSISSAPFETAEYGHLEFYVAREIVEAGVYGRLSESLFKADSENDNRIHYVNRIVGSFTLDKRARGFSNVVMVGTGSGLAPFASMIKQLHFEAKQGRHNPVTYTLFHANRTFEELGYHGELLSIEQSGILDFAYVPSVSRPTQRDRNDRSIGKGRANNLLRMVLKMPMLEEQFLAEATGENISRSKQKLKQIVWPVLPSRHSREHLSNRMVPQHTVFLTCGNSGMMDDVKYIAESNAIQFEKEDW